MTAQRSLNITTGHNPTGNTLVIWQWGELEGAVTPGDAVDRGIALLNVAAISECEARIMEELRNATKSPTASLLQLIRAARPKTMSGINPIYGMKTQSPLVEIFWYGDQLSLDLAEARHHAQAYLEAAETARTDNFMVSAFEDVGLDPEMRKRVFDSFRKYRQQMEA
jgi:hypothetical protein